MQNNNSKVLMIYDDDNQSVCSFDSSQLFSIASRTASLCSDLNQMIIQNQVLKTPNHKKNTSIESETERTVSIEKPRIQIRKQPQQFQQQPFFQIGFVMGKNKKNINFDESKLKKAQNFFDKQQTNFSFNFNDDLFPNNSLMQFPKLNHVRQFREQSFQLSMPCFKNMGKSSNQIKINEQMLKKAKNFFNDGSQQIQNDVSFHKPTKIKKTNINQKGYQENDWIKTVNINKKAHKIQQKKSKKSIFDWNKYQKSSKKIFYKNQSPKFLNTQTYDRISNRSVKKSTQKSSKKSIRKQNKYFQVIYLDDLNIKAYQNTKLLQQFQRKVVELENLSFQHNKLDCQVIKCLLCDLSIQNDRLDANQLQNIFQEKLILEKLQSIKFICLYEQICYKLLKYTTFHPQIINKRLNPSNILIEMHKKAIITQKQSKFNGWIDYVINQNKFYYGFIGEVRQIYHNQKLRATFVKLSDGWTNVWAIITQKNYLFQFIYKLKLFTKLFIGYWRNYPLSNILTFCQRSKLGEKSIQICYNSSILLPQNTRLGKPRNIIFYRPLHLNRKQGGMVPTIEGIVLRMFCIPNSKKKTTNNIDQKIFNDNYLQIITPQKYTVLIKYVLPCDRTLAELFRLYFKYQFYFLKIGQKDSILQFNDQYSKFYEFQKKQKTFYYSDVIQIVKNRYINAMSRKNINERVKVGNCYDIKIQNNKYQYEGFRFIIQKEDVGDVTNTRSFLKGGGILHQQYQLQRIEGDNTQDNNLMLQVKGASKSINYYFKKSKYSNILKSIPTLYQKISQLQ